MTALSPLQLSLYMHLYLSDTSHPHGDDEAASADPK